MNSIELKYILLEHNITLRAIDPEMKTIYINFPDGRTGKIRTASVYDLSVTELLEKIEALKQEAHVSLSKKVFVSFTKPKKKPKPKIKAKVSSCRYYANCTVKCHRGKTGHMRETNK